MSSLRESSYNYVVLRKRPRSVHNINLRRRLNGNSTSYFELTFVRLRLSLSLSVSKWKLSLTLQFIATSDTLQFPRERQGSEVANYPKMCDV